MSSLKKKFVYYKDYADKSLKDVYDNKLLERATHHYFYEPHSVLLLNNGEGGFERRPLPVEAQFSPVYAIRIEDVDQDKKLDILLGGNLSAVKPEVGKYDALHGLVLKGDGNGNFSVLTSRQSGIKVLGETRSIHSIKTKRGQMVLFVRNNDSIKFFKTYD